MSDSPSASGEARLALGAGIGCDLDTARAIKAALKRFIPGLSWLADEMKHRSRMNQPIRTWGGRRYFCEAPKMIEGEVRSFDYKMLNYLVQGSSADMTKEAIIAYDAARKHGRFLVTVHDEINISAPAKLAEKENRILKQVMEAVPFDVLMLSEGKMGPTWGDLR